MFEISRDMFNKNMERALTVYVIPMPASLSIDSLPARVRVLPAGVQLAKVGI